MPSFQRTNRKKKKLKIDKMIAVHGVTAASAATGSIDVAVASSSSSENKNEEDDNDHEQQQLLRRRREQQQQSRLRTLRVNRSKNFEQYMNRNFFNNNLCQYCHVCDRIWWSNKLKVVKNNSVAWRCLRRLGYDPTVDNFKVCETCMNNLRNDCTPLLAMVNGFIYPPEANLPELSVIAERLVSPRLPFMCIRHVRYFEGSKKLYGQIINVPVDVDNMTRVLPRLLNDDYVINVRIKKHLLNKSSYLAGTVSKSILKEWLRYLVETPLYKKYKVTISPEFRDNVPGVPDTIGDSPRKSVVHAVRRHCEVVPERVPMSSLSNPSERTHEAEERLSMMQETMFWGEDFILEMAPGQNNTPLALAFDGDAEELSFPTIYYGHPREFKVPVTPYQMATSEIRRRDRRGVRSNHILYMAGKIMRLNVIKNFNVMFRNNRDAADLNITRAQLEDKEFLRESMNRNESFLACLPNSMQYWQRRKSDVFAMMRKLGKPTIFLTLSASEIDWMPLVETIYRYQQNLCNGDKIEDGVIENMTRTQRAELVNSDPVLCCLYFDRKIDTILNALKLNKGPFGEYRVIDCFRRVEFQHRGSPHCHVLLWLQKSPPMDEVKFVNGEDTPETIKLIDELCCVDSSLVPSDRKLQTHRHTATCYKRSANKCRFGAPFWPMKSTRILLPVPAKDRVEPVVNRFKSLRQILELTLIDENVQYKSIDDFWESNFISSEEEYLNILRHGIARPTVMYKRSMNDIMISPFNPTISKILQSNMDIQYIVDEYTCAAYVAEYVNKSERGFSKLHRELIKCRDEHPEMDYEDLLKEVGKRALNNIEMCTQEAAWYLLRLPMSEASRKMEFIPTQHPSLRFKCKKTKRQMDADGLTDDSTDVWKKNIIQYYESRPENLSSLTLAQVVSEYDRRSVKSSTAKFNSNDSLLRDNEDENVIDQEQDDDDEVEEEAEVAAASAAVRFVQRKRSKVIKWVNYTRSKDELNYKREMATLFWPFRCEELDLLNGDAYLKIFDENEDLLKSRRAEYQQGLLVDEVVTIIVDTAAADDDNTNRNADGMGNDVYEDFIRHVQDEPLKFNDEDIDSVQRDTIVRAVKSLMSHEDFCRMVRTLNYGQRSLLLEVMTRLIYGGEPLQIFFCGPAGSGKTYLLRMLMETVNRFCVRMNTSKCAYVACATTGKAAVNVDGTTVHSALNIPINSKGGSRLASDKLQTMRCDLSEVCTIVVDEVSMMSSGLLNRTSERLRACGKDPNNLYGGFHIVFCGDLRQLPPVRANTIYTRPPNMLEDKMCWQQLQYYPLTEVMRQSDKVFSDILTKLGNGDRLEDFERELLESRFFDSEVLENCPELKSAVRLFHRNKDVDDYNYKRLTSDVAGMIKVMAEDYVIGCTSNKLRTSILQKLKSMETNATGYLAKELCLVLGLPYIITQNIDKMDRIVNGSMGTLRYIETITKNSEEYIVRLWLEFEDERCGAHLRMKYRQHAISHKIESRYTPIVRRELPISMSSKILKVRRKQFPLLPCCAMTIHKVQGGSYDAIIYEYDRTHELALVYVALSRARSLEGLFLTNRNKNHKFYHGRTNNSRPELSSELKRLETKRLITMVDRCSDFIRDAKSQNELTVGVFNVQSLNAHSVDVANDHVLKDLSVLALSETWMNGEDGIGCGHPRNKYNLNDRKCMALQSLSSSRSHTADCNRQNSENFNGSCMLTDYRYGAEDTGAIKIEGFTCVSRVRSLRANETPPRGGGVAIYESLKSSLVACHKVDIRIVNFPFGEACCAMMKYFDKHNREQILCLICIYCQPSISGQRLMDFMDEVLWRFTRGSMELQSCHRGDLYWCPLIVCGDFNYNFLNDSHSSVVLDYFKNTHMLDYASKGMGVTYRGKTAIDALFVKNTPSELIYYTLYFSSHRAILLSTKTKRKRAMSAIRRRRDENIDNKQPKLYKLF